MSRTPYTIERFDKGIICAAEGEELPLDSTPWSIDQDCEPPVGMLRGRNEDEIFVNNATRGNNAQAVGWIVREDGKRDFLYYDSVNGKVKSITDFFGTKAYADQVTMSASLQVSIESINRSARIGWGNNAVKYVGYIDHGQFGGSAPSGLQAVDSKLDNETKFPLAYKAVGDATYSYAYEFQGKKIFKITLSSGVFTVSSTTFNRIDGMCWDGTYIYVLDGLSGLYGTLYKLDTNLVPVTSYSLSGWDSQGESFGGAQSGIVTDIELNADNTKMFFGGKRSISVLTAWSGTAGGTKFIYSLTMSGLVNGQAIIPDDCTPLMVNENTPGIGDNGKPYHASNTYASINLPHRMFVKLGYSSEIGILIQFSGQEIVYDEATPNHASPTLGMLIINSSFAAGGLYVSASSTLIEFTGFSSAGRLVGVYSKYVGAADMFFLSSYSDGEIYTYVADGGVSEEYKIGSTYNWGTAKWQVLANDGSMVSADADNIREMMPMTKPYASLAHQFQIFQGYNGYTLGGLTSVDPSGRMMSTNVADDGTTFGTVTFVKKSNIQVVVEHSSGTDGALESSKSYYYKYALVYQDYQYSPLETYNTPVKYEPASGTANVAKITFLVKSSSLNSRVTGIAVFRAESVRATLLPTTPFRMVGEVIDMRQGWTLNSESEFGNYNSITIYDDGSYGVSYENESGIPESLPNNYMRYSIATQGGGYLFVGQCYNEELESAANIIFRSKQNAPDTFDWSNDFLVLPTRPLALKYFKNVLYAFDANVMYIIDPASLTLMNAVEGAGVESPLAVTATEDLMFFGNVNNAFMHDGKSATPISAAVNISEHTSIGGATLYPWRTLMTSSFSMSAAIHSKKNCVIFGFSKAATDAMFLVYHYPSRAWYYWVTSSTIDGTDVLLPSGSAPKMVFADQYGQAYLSCQGGIVKLNSSSSFKACTWFSQQFNGGDMLSLKRFYKITLNGSTNTRYLAYDNSTTFSTSFTAGAYLTSFLTRRSIWMKLNLGATDVVRGITVILRRMVGHR